MIEHENFNNAIIEEGELLLFRALWNTSNDNMFIVTKTQDGEYTTNKVNPSLLQTLQLKKDQVENIALKEVLDSTTYNKVKKTYEKCIKLKKPISYEEVHNVNNSKKYWYTTILPVFDNKNNTTRILGVSREVTELKEANEILEIKVKERTKELEKALEDIKQISITDKLTNIYNRRYLDTMLENISKDFKRYGTVYGVMIFDIDDFKLINDNFGHQTGDIVLKVFSKLLKNSIRQTDILGRWGGEEFLLIIPHAKKESMIKLAQTLRENIEKHIFPVNKKVTTSIGLTIQNENDNHESLIIRADIALYKAKRKGKNQVQIELN